MSMHYITSGGQVISGPHAIDSDAIKRATSCGNPWLLDADALVALGVLPDASEGGREFNRRGPAEIVGETVVRPVLDMTADDISAAANVISQRIDTAVDAVYAAVIGNRQAEYAEAEAEARAYATAGYTGTVPPSVASWVQASGLSAQAAADNILSTATAWRGAAQAMRAARLAHKAQAKAATTSAQLDAVSASWAATLAQIRAALGL